MQPRIVQLNEKKLIGQKVYMSLMDNKTTQLWKNFRGRSNEITTKVGGDFFSIQSYPIDYFKDYDPKQKFYKWAAVEVSSVADIPVGMEAFFLTKGAYAVFDYKGSSADPTIFQYIYNEWLPSSGNELEDRPHFEVLGEKYRNNDPNSEEEIWIPIKQI